MASETDATVNVIERVADILDSLSGGEPEQGITELSSRLNLGKSTVHRLVSALVKRGYMQQNPINSRYSLGPAAIRLGLVSTLRALDIRSLAMPLLEQLRDQTGETTTLSIRHENQRVYIAQVESHQEIRQTVELGRIYPLYLGATGKVILAFLPESECEQVLEMAGKDERVNLQNLRADLAEIAQKGYATSRGERSPDAASVAAPIYDQRQQVIGAMSVAGPVSRITPVRQAEFVPFLSEAATNLSRQLGASWQNKTNSEEHL